MLIVDVHDSYDNSDNSCDSSDSDDEGDYNSDDDDGRSGLCKYLGRCSSDAYAVQFIVQFILEDALQCA